MNKMLTYITLLLVLAVYVAPTYGFVFDNENKKSIDLKFKLINNLIILPVSINGSDSMNFILDSGVKDPIITELTLLSELSLNYVQTITLRGLGQKEAIQAYQSENNKISVTGLTVKQQKINVVLDEELQISQITGIPVHGLIGLNLFSQYIIKIDYIAEKIKLTKPQFYSYKPHKNDIILPISFIKGKPVIQSEIVQDNNISVPVNLLLDTGASDALWLSLLSHPNLELPKKNTYSFLGAGLGGDIFGHKGRIKSISLGKQVLNSPIVSYPESEFTNNIINSEQRNGSIGGEILRRFTVTFDYINQKVLLSPNTHIKNPFHYNMSGLEVISPIPGIPLYSISNVIEGSPAWNAGIRKEDQIMYINYRAFKDLKLSEINNILQSRPRNKIRMTLKRNGIEYRTSFVLHESL